MGFRKHRSRGFRAFHPTNSQVLPALCTQITFGGHPVPIYGCTLLEHGRRKRHWYEKEKKAVPVPEWLRRSLSDQEPAPHYCKVHGYFSPDKDYPSLGVPAASWREPQAAESQGLDVPYEPEPQSSGFQTANNGSFQMQGGSNIPGSASVTFGPAAGACAVAVVGIIITTVSLFFTIVATILAAICGASLSGREQEQPPLSQEGHSYWQRSPQEEPAPPPQPCLRRCHQHRPY